jgi:hypothetical protein
MQAKWLSVCVLVLVLVVASITQGQTLRTQTTWGGTGSDVAGGVATDADGNSYVVGITDSFAVDQFGQPSPRIFLVKFAPDGTLAWQRIWNRTTIRGGCTGFYRPGVAVGPPPKRGDPVSVYVTGLSTENGNDAVLLKFAADGTLLWERTWGGGACDESLAVATDVDGSAYIVGTETSFGAGGGGFFVVKFDAAGRLVWQKIADGAEGMALAVAPDGSVYAAGSLARATQVGNFDMLVMKITSAGALVWQRTYTAGDQADARGGMAAAPDGSMIVIAGALQSTTAKTSDITALIVALSPDGTLIFDNQFAGTHGEEGTGVTVAPDNGTIYVTGTTTSFGAGNQDAFVLHLTPDGKKILDAVTWGGTQFEESAGVAVSGTTLALAATTTAGPPYSLLPAAAKLSFARGTLADSTVGLVDGAGTVANPKARATTPTGSTTFQGNSEAALVRIAR